MSSTNTLKYPKKSHRKLVVLPVQLEQANVTVNGEVDAEFANYVSNLCLRLFGIKPAFIKRKDSKALVISLASTTVVDFLVDGGLNRGNKLFTSIKFWEKNIQI